MPIQPTHVISIEGTPSRAETSPPELRSKTHSPVSLERRGVTGSRLATTITRWLGSSHTWPGSGTSRS